MYDHILVPTGFAGLTEAIPGVQRNGHPSDQPLSVYVFKTIADPFAEVGGGLKIVGGSGLGIRLEARQIMMPRDGVSGTELLQLLASRHKGRTGDLISVPEPRKNAKCSNRDDFRILTFAIRPASSAGTPNRSPVSPEGRAISSVTKSRNDLPETSL